VSIAALDFSAQAGVKRLSDHRCANVRFPPSQGTNAMKRSVEQILTTHAGWLERPEAMTQAIEQHPDGRPTDATFAGQLKNAVAEIVKAQVDAGLDVVNDGEFGKLSWSTYLTVVTTSSNRIWNSFVRRWRQPSFCRFRWLRTEQRQCGVAAAIASSTARRE
jgi:hypothetical protein